MELRVSFAIDIYRRYLQKKQLTNIRIFIANYRSRKKNTMKKARQKQKMMMRECQSTWQNHRNHDVKR